MMDYCPTCHQPIVNPMRTQHLTKAELNALSAWWWARSARGAARVLNLSEQTVKNQLMRARQRNDCRKTLELVQLFFGELRTLEELTSHNPYRRAA